MEPLQPGDPPQVGAYRLLGRLGAGGMGQVFLGVSPGGRKVAVKVIHAAHATADTSFRTRFRREITAAQRVSGFYTAPVIEADPDATPPWMATAFVAGPSLHNAVADRGALPIAEVGRLGAGLAEGLAAIHKCGLIHRDLKPGNILLAEDGPRIIDFGIARLSGATPLTGTGWLIGTVAFMSPEQVLSAPVGTESDIFSLGSVLAYAATGHAPFDADNSAAIMFNIAKRPPDLPGITGPLREVITDCLSKEPAARPAMSVLIVRLSAIAEATTPPRAPAPPVPPAPAVPSSPARDRAATHGSSGAVLMHVPDDDAAPLSRIAFSPDGRVLAGCTAAGDAWRVYLWDTASGQLVTGPLDGHGPGAPRLAFSPDSRLLAITGRGPARVLRTGSWEPASRAEPEADWAAVAFSPDGSLLATITGTTGAQGFTGTQVQLRSAATLRPVDRTFRLDSLIPGPGLRFSPDGRFLLAGNSGGIFLCDVRASSRGFEQFPGLGGLPGRAEFSADGRLLAAEGTDRPGVTVFDTVTRKVTTRLSCDQRLARLAFSPAGRLLATATGSRDSASVDVWTVDAHSTSRRLAGFEAAASDLRYSPDGAFLAAAADVRYGSQLVCVWRADGTWPATSMPVEGPATLTFSPDSRYLAVGCADQTARLWRTQAAGPPVLLGAPVPPAGPDAGPRRGMAFSPDSRLLATSGPDGTRLWQLP